MNIKEALEKEVNELRVKHMALVKKAREHKDILYGISTLNTYEILINSYSRVLKGLTDNG